jgi:hypothetical protein
MVLRTVRVLANANNKELETVNIVTSQTGHVFETCTQHAGDGGKEIPQVQDSGGGHAGLRTIMISGYTGPS